MAIEHQVCADHLRVSAVFLLPGAVAEQGSWRCRRLVIGRRQDGYDKSFFHGKLDDVRIYNRALTEDEIKLPWMLPNENKPEKGLVFQKRF